MLVQLLLLLLSREEAVADKVGVCILQKFKTKEGVGSGGGTYNIRIVFVIAVNDCMPSLFDEPEQIS